MNTIEKRKLLIKHYYKKLIIKDDFKSKYWYFYGWVGINEYYKIVSYKNILKDKAYDTIFQLRNEMIERIVLDFI